MSAALPVQSRRVSVIGLGYVGLPVALAEVHAHAEYRSGGWQMVAPLLADGHGIVADVKGILDRAGTPEGITLWRL